MRAENFETHTKSLTDELPVCKSTGTGTATNQLYGENGTAGEQHKSYDNSFQCQQFNDRMSLYVVCSGNSFSEFAKEKLVAEIFFGQLNDNAPVDVKDVLRQAFASLERDYLSWIDECLTQQVQNMNMNMNQNRNSIEQFQSLVDEKTVDGIHIALALIFNSKLYTCNVGKCRIILCKTDNSNVLRAVQISAECEDVYRTSYACETLLSRLEIVGPIPLDESQRFLVLMSSGLCKILQDIHKTEQHNINRELIQLIVQQFRTQNSLTAVSQSSVEKLLSVHCANYMQQENNAEFKSRPDATLMIRNFNYPLPNGVQPPQNRNNVTFNPINREHLLSTNTVSSSDQSGNNDTNNSYYTNSSATTTTSSSNRSDFFDKNARISPYVDFSDFYKNIEAAQRNGTLPSILRFN